MRFAAKLLVSHGYRSALNEIDGLMMAHRVLSRQLKFALNSNGLVSSNPKKVDVPAAHPYRAACGFI